MSSVPSYHCKECQSIFTRSNFLAHYCVQNGLSDTNVVHTTKIEPSPVGIKHDAGKPDLTYIRFDAIEQVARVFEFGAKKYPKDGYQSNYLKGMNHTRLLASALRHIMAYIGGESLDPESNLSHLAHSACCILMLLTYKAKNIGTDDRDLAQNLTSTKKPDTV